MYILYRKLNGIMSTTCMIREIIESFSATLYDSSTAMDWNDWTFTVAKVCINVKPLKLQEMQDIPTQTSDSDCGVFVLSHARCVVFGKPFSFNQVSLLLAVVYL